MNKRWFCLILVALLTCSLSVVGPRSVMALTLSSKGSKEAQGERVVFLEELHGRRDVGRRIQQLGFSPAEAEARLSQLTKGEISYLADNLFLIEHGGAGSMSSDEAGFIVCLFILILVAIAASA